MLLVNSSSLLVINMSNRRITPLNGQAQFFHWSLGYSAFELLPTTAIFVNRCHGLKALDQTHQFLAPDHQPGGVSLLVTEPFQPLWCPCSSASLD
jgi:hypothetical protein